MMSDNDQSMDDSISDVDPIERWILGHSEPRQSTKAPPLDYDVIEHWPTEPMHHNNRRVYSLENGNIRGGHWILNRMGQAVTVAFFWRNSRGHILGLTVGSPFQLHDPVFVFLYSKKTQFYYQLKEIGKVISKDLSTDSVVFEVTQLEHRFDLLRLAPESGLGDRELRLPRPSLNPELPLLGSKAILYGAMSQGRFCRMSTTNHDGKIGFEGEFRSTTQATQAGDCGALYLDLRTGAPLAMHHSMTTFEFPYGNSNRPNEFESYGIPLTLIMAKHFEQFDPQMFGIIESAFIEPDNPEPEHCRQGARETTLQVHKFPVTIPGSPVIPDPSARVGEKRKALDHDSTFQIRKALRDTQNVTVRRGRSRSRSKRAFNHMVERSASIP